MARSIRLMPHSALSISSDVRRQTIFASGACSHIAEEGHAMNEIFAVWRD
jgi:hypothetical protein